MNIIMRRLIPVWLVLAFYLFPPAAGRVVAQVDPSLRWRTIETDHFYIHFSDGLESLARQAARYAEVAFARLSSELRAPRGKIDLVVADNRDFANGYASAFPTNRIVVYAMPPLEAAMLRSTGAWLESLITHELVHVFHLGRAEGLWRVGQWVFGRSASLMPNNYSPAWIKEGLAVYYESLLTGEGRLRSGEQHMLLRAAAEEDYFPNLGSLSLVTSRQPEGQSAYVYGSRLLQFLAERGSAGAMDKFVGSMSARIIPFTYSSSSKKAFGMSLGSGWSALTDSLRRTYGTPSLPLPGWRTLTSDGRQAAHPRWVGSDSLVFVRSDGRSVAGLYSLTLDGTVKRLARRNALAVNAVAGDGSLIFAQPEYLDPYTIRYDLYRRSPSGEEKRLTFGARLTSPDVNAAGEIVAVQASPGGSSVVRLNADGELIGRIADASTDAYWADPRWSLDGSSVAAVSRDTSGINTLVLLNSTGGRYTIMRDSLLLASPIWLGADQLLVQKDGSRSQVSFVQRGAGGLVVSGEVTAASTGVQQPAVSPDGSRLAATIYSARGFEIGVAPFSAPPRTSTVTLPPVQFGLGSNVVRNLQVGSADAMSAIDTITARPYSPWRLMLPRYWMPVAGNSSNGGVLVGASTSAYDVVDRHEYSMQLLVNSRNGAIDGDISYFYSGLGRPVLGVSFERRHDYFSVFGGEPRERVGFVRDLSHTYALSAAFRHVKWRNQATLSVATEYERVTSVTEPAELIYRLSNFPRPREYAAVSGSLAWSNTRRPALSISPEDGVALTTSFRERMRLGESARTTSVTASLRGYKSLDLPGFAHHVLALRAAAGYLNRASTTLYGVGGRSGARYEVVPGYSVGDASRLFAVRGFAPGTVVGTQAAALSLEYRLPVAMPAFGLGMFPLFFDRISFTAFGDAGSAWCRARNADIEVCDMVPTEAYANRIVSAGGEINFDSALQYDVPYRLRVGYARVLKAPDGIVVGNGELYFTLGFPF